MTVCRRAWWGAAAIAVALVGSTEPAGSQQAARDGQATPAPDGTSLITGIVVTDETPARPLRRVGVTLSETGNAIMSRLATTDETGRFVFRSLPAGRYTISASRPPFLVGAYGARRPAGPGSVQTGTAIVLADGQQITNIVVKLLPGAVITGVVRDFDGQPADGYPINIWYFQRSSAGERAVLPYRGSYSYVYTDDRGIYRLFGLAPGEYVISVGFSARQSDATITSDADVQRALTLIQRPGNRPTAAGPLAAGAPVPPVRRPTAGYVPIYFPGTPVAAQAAPIALGVGEERTGVDFQLQLASTVRVEGTITDAGGLPAASVQVRAVASGAGMGFEGPLSTVTATSAADGRFSLNGVPPGSYVIDARATVGGVPLWASADVTVQGDDVVTNLSLQPGVIITGRLAFDAATEKPPQNLATVRISLAPATPGQGASALAATAQADGTFTFPGVPPGRYRMVATLPAPAVTRFFQKSAILGGQDAMDVAEIRAGDSVEATILYTDRPSEITGRMTDAANHPAPEYFIIAFAADRAYWTPGSRRIMQTRPAHDGTFVFRNLPPGEYRIAAVTDVDQGEWFDPAFLTQLFDASIRVTLAEGASVTQDIRIR